MLVIDSGAVSALSARNSRAATLLKELRMRGLEPMVVPSMVLVESLTGSPNRDANTDHFLKMCEVRDGVPERVARRAAALRTTARRGSAVDALVVALAEPGSTVLTSDVDDLTALAASAIDVTVELV